LTLLCYRFLAEKSCLSLSAFVRSRPLLDASGQIEADRLLPDRLVFLPVWQTVRFSHSDGISAFRRDDLYRGIGDVILIVMPFAQQASVESAAHFLFALYVNSRAAPAVRHAR
jgi:hypothetical protein